MLVPLLHLISCYSLSKSQSLIKIAFSQALSQLLGIGMSALSYIPWRNGKINMHVLEVLSGNLLFLPSTSSVVRPELASQCPDTVSFSAQFSDDTLAAEAARLETSSTDR